MVVPALEVVVTKIGNHTIDDENTTDGKSWLSAFRTAAHSIPGCIRAGWARSDKYADTCMHFIDYENRHLHDVHKKEIGGPIPDVLKPIMDAENTDIHVIFPSTTDRSVLYAPHTVVVFFYGINIDKFEKVAPEYFTAIAKSDSCLGYIWGEIQPPFLSDKSGNGSLGRGGVMISGWKSSEQFNREVKEARVVEAYSAVSEAVKKTDSWGMQISLVENTGYFHKWRRLFDVDRSNVKTAPGNH